MPRTWPDVGHAFLARKEQLGLSKAELIRASGVSDKTWTKLFRGEEIARIDRRRRMSSALQWRGDAMDRILKGEEPVEVTATHAVLATELEQMRLQIEELSERVRRESQGAAVPEEPQ